MAEIKKKESSTDEPRPSLADSGDEFPMDTVEPHPSPKDTESEPRPSPTDTDTEPQPSQTNITDEPRPSPTLIDTENLSSNKQSDLPPDGLQENLEETNATNQLENEGCGSVEEEGPPVSQGQRLGQTKENPKPIVVSVVLL